MSIYNNMDKIKSYKTYLIAYKFPNDKYAKYKKAWPSCNDDGEIVWTLCEDNCTIIPNKYIIDYKLL